VDQLLIVAAHFLEKLGPGHDFGFAVRSGFYENDDTHCSLLCQRHFLPAHLSNDPIPIGSTFSRRKDTKRTGPRGPRKLGSIRLRRSEAEYCVDAALAIAVLHALGVGRLAELEEAARIVVAVLADRAVVAIAVLEDQAGIVR